MADQQPVFFRIEDFVNDYPHMRNPDLQKKYNLTEHQMNYLTKKLKLRKSRKQRAICCGKMVWSPEEDQFLKDNFHLMNNMALAKALGRRLTNTRTRLYELGLKRMELEYWTDEMIQFLRANYKQTGDTELAEIFSAKWPKNKGWSKKHIEKKRRYLRLKRTNSEIKNIKQKHVASGVYIKGSAKSWATKGVAKEGEIRYWNKKYNKDRPVPYIKVDGRFVHYARYRYTQLHGPIPKGHNAIFLDDDPTNLNDSNLGLVSDADLGRINVEKASKGLSDNYVAGVLSHNQPKLREEFKKHPEIIAIKRLQLQLNREINENL